MQITKQNGVVFALLSFSILFFLFLLYLNPLYALGVLLLPPVAALMIKKPVALIYIQIFYNCVIKFAISNFGLPSAANYLTDLLTAALLIAALLRLCIERKRMKIAAPMAFVLIYFIAGLLSCVVSKPPLLLYIWNFRNTYRFFIFFFACAVFLKKEDITNILKMLSLLYFLHIIAAVFEHYCLGLKGDYVSGIFGIAVGSNAYSNTFLCAVSIYVLILYLNRRITFSRLIFIVAAGLYVATISELKAFYVELVIILLVSVLINRPSFRTIAVFAVLITGSVIAVNELYKLFPTFNNFFNLQSIIRYSSERGYSNANNLNRFTAIGTINRLFFHNLQSLLFGIGPGNAEYSQTALFTSDFYRRYGTVLNYNWFSDAYVFLENGAVGLVSYLMFFVSIFFIPFRLKDGDDLSACYCKMAQITAVMSIAYIFYDGCLRAEGSGYLVFLFLAFPFALYRENSRQPIDSI